MSHLTITTPPAASVASADEELWRLSQRAVKNDQLRAIIESCDSWQIPAVLGVTSAGRDFLAELDAYDQRSRRRAGALSAATWTEDPTPIVELLRELMRWPDRLAPALPSLAA